MEILKDLPTEIWINIIDQLDDLNSIRKVTLIKPDIFHLYTKLHPQDSQHEQIYFKDLHRYQRSLFPLRSDYEERHKVAILELYIPSGYAPVKETVKASNILAYYTTIKPQYCIFHIAGPSVELSDTSFTLPAQLMFVHQPKLHLFQGVRSMRRVFTGSDDFNPYFIDEFEISNDNISGQTYPDLRELRIEGTRKLNDLALVFERLNLPRLESLKIAMFDISAFLNLRLSNLQTFELVYPDASSRPQEFQFMEFMNKVSPEIALDSNINIELANRDISYKIDPSIGYFDFDFQFARLERFKLKMNLQNPRAVEDPIYIYFLTGKIIPYGGTLKELELFFGETGQFQGGVEMGDVAADLVRFVTLGAVIVALKKSQSVLEQFTMRCYVSTDIAYSVRFFNQLSRMTMLKKLTLTHIEIFTSDTEYHMLDSLELPNLEECYLHYEALNGSSNLVNVRSAKLKKLVLKWEGMLDLSVRVPYISYLTRLNTNCPNLDELHLTYFNLSPRFAYDMSPDLNLLNSFIFQPTDQLTLNVRVLSLSLELAECFKFFICNHNLHLPNCQIFRIKNKLGSHMETYTREPLLYHFLNQYKTSRTIPTLQFDAPQLTVLDLGFQHYRWPITRDVVSDLQLFLSKIKIMDKYPNLRLFLHPNQYSFVKNLFIGNSLIGKRVIIRGIDLHMEDELDSDLDDIVKHGVKIFEPYNVGGNLVNVWRSQRG
ncbi:hypothetical protein WICPIJ_000248 [Wickerhamomyces pijperi]|uniref:F-box domain-containing protein n=1 Tax=Wickerhamomyces pijperi TaxID=599730 RepID=A0A9P8TS15_WICPI|nr:hypothetical protein WICPIJ_000248 [Wickerhamomyces pijperi]